EQDEGGERCPGRDEGGFGVELDRERGPVVEVGVAVPPLERAGRGVGAQPVLPGLDDTGGQAEPLVVPGLIAYECVHGTLSFRAAGVAFPSGASDFTVGRTLVPDATAAGEFAT